MDALDFGRKILAKQGFSRLLGTELTRFDADGVEMRLPITEELTQQHGFAHGGVISISPTMR